MLNVKGQIVLVKDPVTRKGNDGKDFTLSLYWTEIGGNMYKLWAAPDFAKKGDVVTLTDKPDKNGSPILRFAKPL